MATGASSSLGAGQTEPMEPWDDAHDEAVRMGRDGYVDPASGYFVFTAESLKAKGSCCGSGCRHCPYPLTDDD
jgi:hypothetical protein